MNQKILDIIIDTIASDRIDWKRTWDPMKAAHNFVTEKEYRGSNAYLNLCGESFITFNQAKAIGATIKKGAKGFPVVYALMMESEEKNVLGNNKKDFKGHRYYTVFNTSDVEGLPVKEKAEGLQSVMVLPKLTAYMEREKIELSIGEPGYSLTFDKVYMPSLDKWNEQNEYNAVLAHECTHSTGATSRLDRFNESFSCSRGSQEYAREELIAELGAMLITGNHLSENSIAYLQSWIQKLAKADSKLEIYKAFQSAQKAVDFIDNP